MPLDIVSGDAFKQLMKASTDLAEVAHRLSQQPFALLTEGDVQQLRVRVLAWQRAILRLEAELDAPPAG